MNINEEDEIVRDEIKRELKLQGNSSNELGLYKEPFGWIVCEKLKGFPYKREFHIYQKWSRVPCGYYCVVYEIKSNLRVTFCGDAWFVLQKEHFIINPFDKSLLIQEIKDVLLQEIVKAVEQGKKIVGIENLPKSMKQVCLFL